MEVVEPALGKARGCYVGVSGRARKVEKLRGRLVLDLALALSDVTGTGGFDRSKMIEDVGPPTRWTQAGVPSS
jgi:hypothetical protein